MDEDRVNRINKSGLKGGGHQRKDHDRERQQPRPSQGPKTRAPEQTLEEVRYIKHLIDEHIPVRVRLEDNSEVSGTIEYYDQSFIRLTREPAEPNLFIYKHEIKYFYEIEG